LPGRLPLLRRPEQLLLLPALQVVLLAVKESSCRTRLTVARGFEGRLRFGCSCALGSRAVYGTLDMPVR
jgi:hypothetical protein